METHKVLDLVYTPEEGQECFSGTKQECNDFINEQGDATFTYKVVPIAAPIKKTDKLWQIYEILFIIILVIALGVALIKTSGKTLDGISGVTFGIAGTKSIATLEVKLRGHDKYKTYDL